MDRVSVSIRAGNGGNGLVSFRREKFIDKGGPDGGDGGNGGDVIFQASRNQNTLANFRYQKLLQAKHGESGGMRKRHGKTGENLLINVPVGTVVNDEDGNVVADLTEDGQKIVIARGGKGGFGNAHFVSSTRQAPRVAEKGEIGEAIDGILELKMIADVGIIGLPNAGKSTLLSIISNAKPAIADYPFTTLTPNLGVVDIDKKQSLLFADIPGLIEGASKGKGLGDDFLRHTERTALLLHLIDAYSEDVGQAYKTIIKELAEYKVDLSTRPEIVVLTKIDGLDKKQLSASLNKLSKTVPKNTPITAISSISGEGVKELLRLISKQVVKNRVKKAAKEPHAGIPVISYKPANNEWNISKKREGFLVTGNKIESFAKRTNFGDNFSEERLLDIMKKMGVIRELERQNIKAGQKIVIGEPSIGQIQY